MVINAKKSVVICGAGTAGLSLAYLLGKHDEFDVTVLEKNDTYARRYGHSIQAIRNYDQPIDILRQYRDHGLALPDELFYPIYKQVRVFPDGEHITISMDGKPTFYAFKRGPRPGSLDHFFHQEISKRVAFHYNHAVDSIDAVQGDIIVGARGSNSDNTRHRLHGYEFQGHSKTFPPHTIVILLDNDIAPGGYVAIIPYPDAGGRMAISMPVAWDTAITPLPEDPLDIVRRVMEKKYIRDTFLGDFVCTNHLASSGQWGTVFPPRDNTIFIGEEFGAMEGGLAYGNANSLYTSIAAYRSIMNGSLDRFMELVRSYGVLDSLRDGIARRRQFRSMGDRDFIAIKDTIVASCGDTMSYERYLKYKDRWILTKPFRIIQWLFDRIVAYGMIH